MKTQYKPTFSLVKNHIQRDSKSILFAEKLDLYKKAPYINFV